jgi:twinkle protein
MKRIDRKITPIPTKLTGDRDIINKFFRSRGIDITDMSTLTPLRLTTMSKFFSSLGDEVMAVGFVYGTEGEESAVKWRPADGRKAFTQDGAARSFYGLEWLDEEPDEIIIVEGEADVIALASVGIQAVSVPNGAPMKLSKNMRVDPEEDRKFSYLWNSHELLEGAEKIILAVDQDTAGDILAEEICRRVGRAKCWRVSFPEGCKDATDVIARHDKKTIKNCIKSAEPMPLQGVYGASLYSGEVDQVYLEGYASGESCGLSVVDDLFTIKEGMVYIVTGYPGDGKSEFIDQIMVNLSLNKSWKWAVASFENPPAAHISKLSEKIVGKPFFEGVTPRMRKDELDEAKAFINDHFVFLENRDGGMVTIHSIMDRARQSIMRLSTRGLVIDPYNYIDMGKTENEHQGITRMLSELGSFARANNIAIFFVAHPSKIAANQNGEMPVPKGHHISGSAAWFAKADIGFTVHRGGMGVGIYCWKARFKWLGMIGDTTIGYDVPTGRYFEQAPSDQEGLTRNKFTSKEKKGKVDQNWQDVDGW